jgi:hypothetical protein
MLNGCGKSGREKMCGVSEINGLAESQAKIFPTVRKLQLWRFCTAAHSTEVPAWIPGFLRRTSFGSGPEDDERNGLTSLIVKVNVGSVSPFVIPAKGAKRLRAGIY